MIEKTKNNKVMIVQGLNFDDSDVLSELICDFLIRNGTFQFYNEIYTTDEMMFDRTVQKVKNRLYREPKVWNVEEYKELVEKEISKTIIGISRNKDLDGEKIKG